ncbi:MAG: hypothetical protein IPK92_21830 [Nitrospira sp.]|nr:hypothetical protein [Nitrospira sp.]
MGYRKDFSQAIYGNFRLVEALASDGRSPLDIPYEILRSWDAAQWVVFGRAVRITLEDYLERDCWEQHSYALYRSLQEIEHSCMDVYKLADLDRDYHSSDIYNRLDTAVEFVKKAVDLIDAQKPIPHTVLRVRDKRTHDRNLYDHMADLMFEIIFHASSITKPPDKCWTIHFNTVWGDLFDRRGGAAWRVVLHKLRRLLYEEIRRLEDYPNYKSSKILGFCLNVMGPKIGDKKAYGYDQHALHKAVLAWTKKNYLKLRQLHPDVAEAGMIGSITFEEQSSGLLRHM